MSQQEHSGWAVDRMNHQAASVMPGCQPSDADAGIGGPVLCLCGGFFCAAARISRIYIPAVPLPRHTGRLSYRAPELRSVRTPASQ